MINSCLCCFHYMKKTPERREFCLHLTDFLISASKYLFHINLLSVIALHTRLAVSLNQTYNNKNIYFSFTQYSTSGKYLHVPTLWKSTVYHKVIPYNLH